MSSRSTAYWCHICRRSIRLPAGGPMLCPTCENGFIEELDSVGQGISGLSIMRHPIEPATTNDPFEFGTRIPQIDFLNSMLSQLQNRVNNNHLRPTSEAPSPGPFVIIGPGLLSNEHRGGRPVNFGDYFLGSNLDQLIEQLTQNDRCGPAPAPRNAIDSMPRVRVTSRHLSNESHCPVCQERFQIGTEVREMPCNHIYHHDCIVPWLTQHNSCPICRHGLDDRASQTASSNVGSSARGRGSGSSGQGARAGNVNAASSNNLGTNSVPVRAATSARENHGRRGGFMSDVLAFFRPRSSSPNANGQQSRNATNPNSDYPGAHNRWHFDDMFR